LLMVGSVGIELIPVLCNHCALESKKLKERRERERCFFGVTEHGGITSFPCQGCDRSFEYETTFFEEGLAYQLNFFSQTKIVMSPFSSSSFTPTTNIVNYTHEDIQRTLERLNNSRAVGAAAAAIGTRTPTTSSGVVAPNGHGGSFNRSASFVAPYLNGGLNGNVADDEDDEDDEDVDCSNHLPSKRIKMSDVNITRYCEEFLEVSEIANGEFGKVTVVRHRLDGMLYAIKVTRHPIQNSAQERTAMNEVFAHAALMKHKHVVRYYNSWVEAGRVYIQNEYCEGGSLADVIRVRREQGRIFAESELKRILLHLAKGLRYIHSKRLVHLDIKPENIFLSFDLVSSSSPSGEEEEGGEVTATDAIGTPSKKIVVVKKAVETATQTSDVEMKEPQPEASKESAPAAASSADTEDSSSQKVLMNTIHDSTDSGHASGNNAEQQLVAAISQRGDGLERVSYKIGDLGHVAPTTCEYVPEEGDCRYMAPELLLHTVDREKLPKADVFSLGLTLFECATLTEMPKNSMEDPMFERLQEGRLPYLPRYSKEFNALLKVRSCPYIHLYFPCWHTNYKMFLVLSLYNRILFLFQTMVLPDVLARPSCSRLVNHPYLKASNASSKAVSRMRTSNLQLHKELQIARNRFKELEILYEAQKQAAASRKAAAKAAAAAKAKAKQTLKTLRGDAAG
jgi:serine/threonine protein kinase